ncbi:hypothetical protein ACDY97_33210 [Rhizobium mongolense]|uniref:hypothetical protein n=1 Tax=Rhizobium mongolense TaxID=57676 RepID=UPI0035579654
MRIFMESHAGANLTANDSDINPPHQPEQGGGRSKGKRPKGQRQVTFSAHNVELEMDSFLRRLAYDVLVGVIVALILALLFML